MPLPLSIAVYLHDLVGRAVRGVADRRPLRDRGGHGRRAARARIPARPPRRNSAAKGALDDVGRGASCSPRSTPTSMSMG